MYLEEFPVGFTLSEYGSSTLRDHMICALPLFQVLHLTQECHQLCVCARTHLTFIHTSTTICTSGINIQYMAYDITLFLIVYLRVKVDRNMQYAGVPDNEGLVQVGLCYVIDTLCPFQVDLILIRMKRCDREE